MVNILRVFIKLFVTNVTVSHKGQNIQEVFEQTFIFFITIGFEIIVVETIPPFQ